MKLQENQEKRLRAIEMRNTDVWFSDLRRRAFHVYSLHKKGLMLIFLAVLLFDLALLLAIPLIVPFWFKVLKFWFDATHFPGGLVGIPFDLVVATVWMPSVDFYSGIPTASQWWSSAIGCIVLWLATSFIPPARLMPATYFIRAMILIHATALVFFAVAPNYFSRDLSSYLFTCMTMGLLIMLIVPWMLGATYYLFDFSIYKKLGLTVLVLAYFIVVIPFQYALHTILLRHLSLLFLPIFYMVFGYLLDVMLIIAFYTWAMTWAQNNDVPRRRPALWV
jgi:hypothetical protein